MNGDTMRAMIRVFAAVVVMMMAIIKFAEKAIRPRQKKVDVKHSHHHEQKAECPRKLERHALDQVKVFPRLDRHYDRGGKPGDNHRRAFAARSGNHPHRVGGMA